MSDAKARCPFRGLGPVAGFPVLVSACVLVAGCASNIVHSPTTGISQSDTFGQNVDLRSHNDAQPPKQIPVSTNQFCPVIEALYATENGPEIVIYKGCDSWGRWLEAIENNSSSNVDLTTIFGVEIFGYMQHQELIVDGMKKVFSGEPSTKVLEQVPAGKLDITISLIGEQNVERAGGHFHQNTYSFLAIGTHNGAATPVFGPPIYDFHLSFFIKNNDTGENLPSWILSDLLPIGNAWHPVPRKSIVRIISRSTSLKNHAAE